MPKHKFTSKLHVVVLPAALLAASAPSWLAAEVWEPVALSATVEEVQPMTGIVVWADTPAAATHDVQLEFSYLLYDDVVDEYGDYDWSSVDALLERIAGRGHQAILRFRYIHPGFEETAVPAFIKKLPDYHETVALSEGNSTAFCDWSHPALQQFALDFHTRFAERYDDDPRLAFVQTGFGLWAEYHIYDGPMELGKTFPSKALQATFLRHLDAVYETTPWSISIDAAEAVRTPFAKQPELKQLGFGLFDDSFMHARHDEYNTTCWNFFGRDRWKTQPAGGEFSYYTQADQENALAPEGMHGEPFADAAARFHLTYMFGNDQPRYRTADEIRQAGMAIGYRFRVLAFETDGKTSRVTITNTGIAPLYHEAYPALGGVEAKQSLKGMLPGESRTFKIAANGRKSFLTIVSPRLVPRQVIGFDAELTAD
ncbi:MAG: DUF4832 domain-containing protein [Planctomycetota bacterium]